LAEIKITFFMADSVYEMFVGDIFQGADVAANSVVWRYPGVVVDTSSCKHGDCWIFPVVQQFSRC